jgi:hypothetical protein
MPIDLLITYESGRQERHNIPLLSMYGAKEEEGLQTHKPWPWTHPTYQLLVPATERVRAVEIDPSLRMLDIDLSNNKKQSEL